MRDKSHTNINRDSMQWSSQQGNEDTSLRLTPFLSPKTVTPEIRHPFPYSARHLDVPYFTPLAVKLSVFSIL